MTVLFEGTTVNVAGLSQPGIALHVSAYGRVCIDGFCSARMYVCVGRVKCA